MALASAALQPGPGGNGNDEYAQFRLTDPADVGQLEAEVGLSQQVPLGSGLLFTLVASEAGVVTVSPGPAQTSSGSWRTVAPMPTAREGLAAVAGPDGKIYAIGGLNTFGYLTTLEAYNPSTNTWTCSAGDTSSGCSSMSVTPMPTARQSLAAATGSDGRIYAMGGSNPQIATNGGGPLTTVEAYNPSTNTWACSADDTSSGCSSTRIAPMPTAREGLAAVAGPDGKIYAIGGTKRSGTSNTVEAYNPSTNTWACSVGDTSSGCASTNIAPMPTTRWALAAATGLDGRIYAIGGYNGSVLSTVEVYDPASNTWATIAPMPTRRYILAAATGSDGHVYALGGCCSGGLPLNTVEAYDPSTKTWSTVAPMSTARHGRCWWSRYERTSPAQRRGQYLPPYRDHAAEQGQPWVSRMPSLSSTIPSCLVLVHGTNDHFWRG